MDRCVGVFVLGSPLGRLSLTARIVNLLFSNGTASWRGTGRAHPNAGYERFDLSMLNIASLHHQHWGGNPGTAVQETIVDARLFRRHARHILDDMGRQRTPFVLKDPNFTRTLSWWYSVLQERALCAVCLIGVSSPVELSAVRRDTWERHNLAAILSVRTARCPTLIVAEEKWQRQESAAEVHRIRAFLERHGLLQSSSARLIPRLLRRLRHRPVSSSSPLVSQPLRSNHACLWHAMRKESIWHWPISGNRLENPCNSTLHAPRGIPSE